LFDLILKRYRIYQGIY